MTATPWSSHVLFRSRNAVMGASILMERTASAPPKSFGASVTTVPRPFKLPMPARTEPPNLKGSSSLAWTAPSRASTASPITNAGASATSSISMLATVSADAPVSSATRMAIVVSPEKSFGGSYLKPSSARLIASTLPLNVSEDEFAGHTPSPSCVAIFIPTGFAASNNRPVLAFKSSDTSSASASVTTMPRTLISVSSLPDQCMSPRNEGAAFVGATRIEHVASDVLITVPFRPSIPLSLNSMGCVPLCDARYTNS
mmetsp:Transcript_588/g.1446  ORF Transcript_588/g.1446 Transcript_588/m.1446 type:complete len:257 (-) Transcript_588:918-1688(-)